jgi:hypothetical protein
MDHPGNPLYEGTATAARGIAESVAALVMLAEYLRRSRELTEAAEAHRKLEDATREDLQRRRNEAGYERRRGRDASQWRLALDKGWMRTATVDEVVHVWSHSLPWLREDVLALQAKRFAEARLERLDPDLVRRYRHHQAKGLDPLTAMMNARRPPTHRSRSAARPLELEAPKPIPMGPTGWTDAARARAARSDRVTALARTGLDAVVHSDMDETPKRRRQIATYDDAVTAANHRPFHRTGAALADDDEHTAAEGLVRSRTR